MKLEVILVIIMILGIIIVTINLNKGKDEGSDVIKYVPKKSILTTFEGELLELINKHRMDLNVIELVPEKKCRDLSFEHINYMINNGRVSHDLAFKRKNELFKCGATSFSETVGFGYSTPKSLLNGYLKSETHKNIIEGEDFTHIGVGALKNNEGKYYNTLIFAKF